MSSGLILAGVITLVVGVILVISVILHLQEKRRTEALAGVAESMKFDFTGQAVSAPPAGLSDIPLFQKGHSRKTANVLSGVARGVAVSLFDYRYTTGSGKNQQTHKQTILAIESEDLDGLPEFELCPESIFHRFASLFGYQDINFPDRPAFSKAFLLRGKNEIRIRSLFNDYLFEFFEARRDVSAHACRRRFIYFRQGKLHEPEKYDALLREGFELFALLKAAV